MRPVCHLHIGMNKAGSTTIQAAFADGAGPGLDVLPGQGGSDLYRLFAVGFRDRTPSRFLDGPGDPVAARHAARAELNALLAASDRPLLLSCEDLSALPSRENVRDVLDAILRHAREVRVLCYVRPPRAYLRSALQQALKIGPVPDDLAILWPGYRPRIERWDAAAGPRVSVDCVAFRKDRFAGGDLVTDVCRRIGVERARLGTVGPRNETLSLEATAMLVPWQAARRSRPQRDPEEAQTVVAALRGFGATHDWGFSDAALAPVLSRRQVDLDWAAERTACPDFGAERRPAVTLDGLEALHDVAARQSPAFADWARRAIPALRPDGDDPVAILDALQAATTRRPGEWRPRLDALLRRLRLRA